MLFAVHVIIIFPKECSIIPKHIVWFSPLDLRHLSAVDPEGDALFAGIPLSVGIILAFNEFKVVCISNVNCPIGLHKGSIDGGTIPIIVTIHLNTLRRNGRLAFYHNMPRRDVKLSRGLDARAAGVFNHIIARASNRQPIHRRVDGCCGGIVIDQIHAVQFQIFGTGAEHHFIIAQHISIVDFVCLYAANADVIFRKRHCTLDLYAIRDLIFCRAGFPLGGFAVVDDFFQVGTACKHILAKRFDLFWQCDFLQIGAALKHIVAHFFEIFGQCDTCQIGAALECCIFDIYHCSRYLDTSQTGTALKGRLINVR